MKIERHASAALVIASVLVGASDAHAQPAAAGATESHDLEEVVVTARKRDETSLSVPVTLTALGSKELERYAVSSLKDVAALVPSLIVNQTISGGGGAVYLRGVGTTNFTNPSLDQTVTIDLDGVPVSRGNILRVGQYDTQQIEILKGPQAVFFGRNAPAGVISITSASPTDRFEAMARAGYEFYARQKFGEAMVSGPVSDTLGLRLFARYDDTDGYFKNQVKLALPANAIRPNTVFPMSSDRGPQNTTKFIRLTADWKPTDRFSVLAKASYTDAKNDGLATLKQKYHCPLGREAWDSPVYGAMLGTASNPALLRALAVDDCTLNRNISPGGINPATIANSPQPQLDPDGGLIEEVTLASVEMKYDVTPSLQFTSVTGYFLTNEQFWFTATYGAPDAAFVDLYNQGFYRQFTEEVRLTTNFTDSPFNGMIGAYYEDAFFHNYVQNLAVAPRNIFDFNIPGRVWAAFGQATWKVTPTLELGAGVRYSSERRELDLTRDGVLQPVANRSKTWENTSPEVTLTWRPRETLTLYGAYKEGFKSGGYAAGISGNAPPLPASPLRDFLFQPESVSGYEFGLKTAQLDNSLRFNIAYYDYDYTNLQVNSVDFSGGSPIIRTSNAAAANVKGVEADMNWRPEQVEGLTLRASVNYNRARYKQFISPCYVGQTIAGGCNILPAGGVFTSQDLSGRPLTNASDWNATLGYHYERDVGEGDLVFGVSTDLAHRSKYYAMPDQNPFSLQKAATFLDASLNLKRDDGGWEVALIGKNLTNVLRVIDAGTVPGTGFGTGTAVGVSADLNGNTTYGRTIMIQFTLRPSAWNN